MAVEVPDHGRGPSGQVIRNGTFGRGCRSRCSARPAVFRTGQLLESVHPMSYDHSRRENWGRLRIARTMRLVNVPRGPGATERLDTLTAGLRVSLNRCSTPPSLSR